jgi:hypothetical protein
VIAEKLEAMVFLDEANSRIKDFYDVWFLGRRFEFDGETLVQAIRATFDRRKTKLSTSVPLALTREFAILKTGQWNAFVQRNKLSAEPFPRVIDAIHTFAAPPLLASSAGERFPSYWSPGGNWKAASQESGALALRHFVQATGNQIGLNSDSERIHAVHGLHQPFQ